ncbi:MAG TPA: methyltransferase domain-containing protein [Xanthobacteraceae bacterium]|jgi:ubiquinone/menaquinone biosynthesis C-methylase UbiE|nr:methyltransferase domain-containing protein [Xanthobacteraceae bacterium]
MAQSTMAPSQTHQTKSHEALVGGQFGARAAAYLGSTVHAQGADLQALADLVRGQSEARVLDLGCGAGHVSFHVAPEVGEVVAYDLSPEMLEVVTRSAHERGLRNISTQQGVAEKLPFPDSSFDYVMSRYSAHHWHDFDAGLREVTRVLRRGGTAAFVDSISPGAPLLDTYLQAVEVLRDPSHVRSYSRTEWDAALTRAGLMPVASHHFRLRMNFAVWTERMRTPKVQSDAIRALQQAMSETVTRYFAIDADGSFDLDIAFVQASVLMRSS